MNILITGANGGLGQELTRIFAENNHRVYAISRHNNNLTRLIEDFDVHFLQSDISIDTELDILSNKLNELDSIDIVINNASVLNKDELEHASANKINESIQTNLHAAIIICKVAIPKLKRSKNAHIINISSMSGVSFAQKFEGMSVYGATKAGLNAFTESLAVELSKYNIHVNAIALSAVQTPMLDQAFSKNIEAMHPKEVAAFIFDISLKYKGLFNGKIIPLGFSVP